MILTLSVCASFVVTAQASDEYDHIGFDYMPSAYTKGQTQQLEVTAYDADNDETTFEGDLVFESSNPQVVSVDENGLMTMNDYGIATVTAKSGDLTASMLVTVKVKDETNIAEDGNRTKNTNIVRTGSHSLESIGGTLAKGTEDYAFTYANISRVAQGTFPQNGVVEAWFYDNGETTDSEVALYMSAYKNDTRGSKAIGVINSADTTYKLTKDGARRALSASNVWREGTHVGVDESNNATIDTGIQRTKGWHQVIFVRKNVNILSEPTVEDGGARPKSKELEVYLDGQLVDSEVKDRSFLYLYAYAGYNTSNTAYVADFKVYHLADMKDVKLTEENDSLKVNYTYYGPNEERTVAYKWQSSADGIEWADIAGEVNATYTPTETDGGKFIRGGVQVSTKSATTEYRFTDAYYVFDGTYEYLSFGKSQSSLTKGATKNLTLTGYSHGSEYTVSDFSNVTFTSSNEDVVTVNAEGVVTAKDYGIATVTAKSGDLTASMMVTVKVKDETNIAEDTSRTKNTAIRRTGSYSLESVGGTLLKGELDCDFKYAQISRIGQGTFPQNGVVEAWFYDNGESENSQVALYMSAYKNDARGTKAVGIINSSDATYKLTEKGARRAKANGSTWHEGTRVGIDETNTGTIDTGIKRTKGWHQVIFVRKNVDVLTKPTVEDGGARPLSKELEIYLDGQLVDSESGDKSFLYIYAYAGFDSSNTAYVADFKVYHLADMKDVKLTEENDSLKVNYTYYGPKEERTVAYKWQSSADAKTWTDISGATAANYTPVNADKGKFIRGGVKVSTASATTEYRYTDTYYVFDGTYDSINLGKSQSSLAKGATQSVVLTGYSHGSEYAITDLSNVTFTSSNEDVVTVNDEGVITAKDYGVATITASSGDLTAGMLVTVKVKDESNVAEDTNRTKNTAIARTGSYSLESVGGTLLKGTEDYAYNYANISKVATATFPSNGVLEAWFYDNGELENSEVALYMSAYKNDTSGSKAIGVINSADTTYKLTGNARRSLSGQNAWREGSRVGVYEGIAITDTGIQRTKGWHQVVFVRKNANVATASSVEDGGSRPLSKELDIYLDGQLVDSEVKDRSFLYLYAYAGYNKSNTAYVADIKVYHLAELEDVSLAANDGALTATYNYYGPTGANATKIIKWYKKGAAEDAWTVIDGATSATYTPDISVAGKYIRAGIAVTDGDISIAERFTEAYYVEHDTNLEYADGNAMITSSEAIQDAVIVIAEYMTVGSFVKLVSARTVEEVNCDANQTATIPVGTIAPATGNYIKVMLWNNLESQKALCEAILVD